MEHHSESPPSTGFTSPKGSEDPLEEMEDASLSPHPSGLTSPETPSSEEEEMMADQTLYPVSEEEVDHHVDQIQESVPPDPSEEECDLGAVVGQEVTQRLHQLLETGTPALDRHIEKVVQAFFEKEGVKIDFGCTVYCAQFKPGAKIPTRAHESDAGWDLYALTGYSIAPNTVMMVRTGLSFVLPDGWMGSVRDRSSRALQTFHVYGGVIDAGFRGELCVLLHNGGKVVLRIAPGEKIAQIVFSPIGRQKLIEIRPEQLPPSDRGVNGFGSTGST